MCNSRSRKGSPSVAQRAGNKTADPTFGRIRILKPSKRSRPFRPTQRVATKVWPSSAPVTAKGPGWCTGFSLRKTTAGSQYNNGPSTQSSSSQSAAPTVNPILRSHGAATIQPGSINQHTSAANNTLAALFAHARKSQQFLAPMPTNPGESPPPGIEQPLLSSCPLPTSATAIVQGPQLCHPAETKRKERKRSKRNRKTAPSTPPQIAHSAKPQVKDNVEKHAERVALTRLALNQTPVQTKPPTGHMHSRPARNRSVKPTSSTRSRLENLDLQDLFLVLTHAKEAKLKAANE